MEKDWLANTEQEYIDLAIKAASDIPELIQTRKTLRDRFLASSLCQVQSFIESLEQEYFATFDRWKSAAWELQVTNSSGKQGSSNLLEKIACFTVWEFLNFLVQALVVLIWFTWTREQSNTCLSMLLCYLNWLWMLSRWALKLYGIINCCKDVNSLFAVYLTQIAFLVYQTNVISVADLSECHIPVFLVR